MKIRYEIKGYSSCETYCSMIDDGTYIGSTGCSCCEYYSTSNNPNNSSRGEGKYYLHCDYYYKDAYTIFGKKIKV